MGVAVDTQALVAYGWDEHVARALEAYAGEGDEVGRVIVEHRIDYGVAASRGELRASVPGRLRRLIEQGKHPKPAVGDWVVLSTRAGAAVLQGVLPRRTKLVRKAAGRAVQEQVAAANADYVFIVSSLAQPQNLRRIERFLALARDSGAAPVLVLTKADLCADPESPRRQIEAAAPGVPVHVVSGLTGQGLEELKRYLRDHRTAVLVGASGVGKSTLINRLLGEEHLATGELGAWGKGRHTTTRRELVLLPQGGIIIDTPGMRELGMWEAQEGLLEAFSDIAELSVGCKFRNCLHEREPGCAVRQAVDEGRLSRDRYESFLKLRREVEALERQRRRGRR